MDRSLMTTATKKHLAVTVVLAIVALFLGNSVIHLDSNNIFKRSTFVNVARSAALFSEQLVINSNAIVAEELMQPTPSPKPKRKKPQPEVKKSAPSVAGAQTQGGGPTPTPTYDIQPFPTISPNACPVSTMACIPCNAGESYCRFEQGETTGYLGWACQNNNPGNIRYSQSRIDLIVAYGGTAPCGSNGPYPASQYMMFSNYIYGRNGLKAYLKAIADGAHSSYNPECANGGCSLRLMFSKYAPAADQNDPNSYSNFVANYIGVDVDNTPLGWIVENKLDGFADAIQIREGWFVQ
ncbi:MAG: hypothetical protein ACE5DX_02840 [Candidatus Dojkabacteria bacterium]